MKKLNELQTLLNASEVLSEDLASKWANKNRGELLKEYDALNLDTRAKFSGDLIELLTCLEKKRDRERRRRLINLIGVYKTQLHELAKCFLDNHCYQQLKSVTEALEDLEEVESFGGLEDWEFNHIDDLVKEEF